VDRAAAERRSRSCGGIFGHEGGDFTGEFSWVAEDNSYVDNLRLVQFLPFLGHENAVGVVVQAV
jgi:hypothetical protein